MPAPRPLNILCFGDSLTSGYCSFGLNSHPYSIRLGGRLAEALPDVRLEVFTNGVPGDVAQNEPFKMRLDAECMFYSLVGSGILTGGW
jgi:lysophospholipase L1-like esterase